jgi:hypothetical protein
MDPVPAMTKIVLCKEHLGLDVLISLPKPPPR